MESDRARQRQRQRQRQRLLELALRLRFLFAQHLASERRHRKTSVLQIDLRIPVFRR